jgi:hypothetical protein
MNLLLNLLMNLLKHFLIHLLMILLMILLNPERAAGVSRDQVRYTMPAPPVPILMPLLFADNFKPLPLTAPAATGILGKAGRTNKVNSQQD